MHKLPHAASPVSHRSPTPSPLEQPSPGAGPRARSAEVRPSSWRIAGIPLAPLGQAIARGLRAMSCCIRPRAAQGLDRVREQPSSPSFDAKNRSGELSIHDLTNPSASSPREATNGASPNGASGSRPGRPAGAPFGTGTPTLPLNFAHPEGPRHARGPTIDNKHQRTEDFGEGSADTGALITKHNLTTTLPPPQIEVNGEMVPITPVKGDWPEVAGLDLAAFRKIHPKDLEELLEFCKDVRTADGLLFLIAAENLLATAPGSEERTRLASDMLKVFIGTPSNSPPMEVNLSGVLKKGLRTTLVPPKEGQPPSRATLETTLGKAQAEILQAFSQGPYWKFTKSLPTKLPA